MNESMCLKLRTVRLGRKLASVIIKFCLCGWPGDGPRDLMGRHNRWGRDSPGAAPHTYQRHFRSKAAVSGPEAQIGSGKSDRGVRPEWVVVKASRQGAGESGWGHMFPRSGKQCDWTGQGWGKGQGHGGVEGGQRP